VDVKSFAECPDENLKISVIALCGRSDTNFLLSNFHLHCIFPEESDDIMVRHQKHGAKSLGLDTGQFCY
jgi:hypothetical protein